MASRPNSALLAGKLFKVDGMAGSSKNTLRNLLRKWL